MNLKSAWEETDPTLSPALRFVCMLAFYGSYWFHVIPGMFFVLAEHYLKLAWLYLQIFFSRYVLGVKDE